VRELFHAFGAWWLREFLDLFPQRLAHWLVDNGGRTLVLASEGDAIALHLTTDRGRLLASSRVTRADYSPELIDEFLAKQRHRRTSVTIGLSLPEELIFQRSFILPLETRRTLDTVVVQDLLAKTPFQLDDIYHAHRVDRAGGKLVVSQCVVRRAHAAAAAGTFDLKPEDIAFIQPDNTAHHADQPRIVTTSPSSIKRNHWAQRIGVGLVATALLLAIWGLGTRYHRQQVVLDALQTEVAAAAAKAKSVQGMIEKLRSERALLLRLRAKRDEPGLGDIWEEATRILPAHTWLTELRLSETPDDRHLVMTGFSAAAASLVGLLDRSSVFGEASLVGPTTVDPTEAKERFIIQAKLKRPASSKTPSQ
jgi:general secretion pathway protein L